MPGLIGHWPLEDGGQALPLEVPAEPAMNLGAGDFTLAAWIHTAQVVDGALGDVLSQYDPVQRRGFHLSIHASSGGYSSHGDDRHVHFGIDDGATPEWVDCGRPSPTSNYVSNSLTAFDGHLYAGITDALREEDWCHVFRYAGGQAWEDCGRLGSRRTRGAGPMIAHRGRLYAATWSYDWTRVGQTEPLEDFCRVYRHEGGRDWADCGQPGHCRRLFGLASFRGDLYVTAEDGRCYVHAGDRNWEEIGRFPNYAHPMGVHAGRLYAGVLNPAGVWVYDGAHWTDLGNPLGSEERCDQVHALQTYRGRLHATTWPSGHVARLEPGGSWTDCGRLGDALEVNGLAVYNGKLYAGTIPRAEVFRYDEDRGWSSVGRFLEPAGHVFRHLTEWARVTSLTVFDGSLFASLGSCTSSRLDAPCDFRGRVYAMRSGACVSWDRELGPGWKHLTAIKRGGQLELHLDGEQRAVSRSFDPNAFDLSCEAPLKIGGGEIGNFAGSIRDAQVYGRALGAAEVRQLAARTPLA
jgi:hypothetical protein